MKLSKKFKAFFIPFMMLDVGLVLVVLKEQDPFMSAFYCALSILILIIASVVSYHIGRYDASK